MRLPPYWDWGGGWGLPLLLLLYCLYFPLAAAECEYNKGLQGCQCNNEHLEVVCEYTDIQVIPMILNPSMVTLILSHSKIESIKATLHFYVELIRLDLSYNQIFSIEDRSFKKQKNLHNLNLSHNKISTIDDKTFTGLRKLQVLNLAGNLIEQLSYGQFSMMEMLKELDLSENRIKNISTKTFEGLSLLAVLDLSDNLLTSVPSDTFLYIPQLAELSLDRNTLGIINERAFDHFTALTRLTLENCGIENITATAFGGIEEVRTLSLRGNRLTTIPGEQLKKLIHIEDLNLGQNLFKELPPDALPGQRMLSRVDFSACENLWRVRKDVFLSNQDIHEINLNYTAALKWLEEGAFSQLPRLRVLGLHSSGLQSLSPYAADWASLSVLDISNVPLACDCQLAWLRDLMYARNNSGAVCESPFEVRNIPLMSLSDDELSCNGTVPSKSTFIAIGVVLVILFVIVGSLVIFKCRRCRNTLSSWLQTCKWHRPMTTTTQSDYHKTGMEDEFMMGGGRTPMKPVPVTEL